MASLSVPLPWQPFVAAALPELRTDIERTWPAITIQFTTGPATLHADLDVDTDRMTLADAAYLTADRLAILWPAILTDHGVALEVNAGGCTWQASPGLMARTANGIGATPWLAETTFLAPGE